jgi:hypothetical protein
MREVFMQLLLLPIALLSQPSFAQSDTTPSAQTATSPFDVEVGLRYRSLSVPNSLMAIWFTDASDDEWVRAGEDRPDISATSIGVEYILKWDMSNTIIYFDYISSRTIGGYWDDRDDDWDDGSYVLPTDNLALLNLGADYLANIKLIKIEQTEGKFGLDLMLGGGLGVAFVTGDVRYWEQNEQSQTRSWRKYECYLTNPVDGVQTKGACSGVDTTPLVQKIPRVLPMIDVIAALRFNIMDKTAIRLEGGLHDLLYLGIGLDVAL